TQAGGKEPENRRNSGRGGCRFEDSDGCIAEIQWRLMDMRRGAAVPAALRDSAGPPGKRFFADAEPRAAGRCRPCGAERFSKAAEKVCFPLLKRRKQQ
ncbi:hypothetical protein, partial [Ruthenibacterium lactatiformans]|uniref:hypothetical protein n=1 Tax=Ruthenibacterium lactatiformans TaxID=1550024 RepID=UPI003FD72AE2